MLCQVKLLCFVIMRVPSIDNFSKLLVCKLLLSRKFNYMGQVNNNVFPGNGSFCQWKHFSSLPFLDSALQSC